MEIEKIGDVKSSLDDISMTKRDRSLKMLNEILSLLPQEYSKLIESAFKYKRIPKEYMLSSILFTVSTSIGLTFFIDVLDYKNYGNLYFGLIGSRGDAKTEALKVATKPIKKLDDFQYKHYCEDLKLCKSDESEEIIRKQNLIQNATIESVYKIHSENPKSVGIMIDEIFSLIERMGNPNSRDGIPWRTFLLEGFTNGFVDVARKTTKSFRINETYPTLIGGLQHQFVSKLFANGNLESGFVDRVLFTPKLTSNNKLTRGQITFCELINYHSSITNILAYKKQSEQQDESIKQFKIKVSSEADQALFNYTQELVERKEKAPPILEEYISKMQISIHKLCINLFMMKHSKQSRFDLLLDIDTVNLAILLNEFYFNNFQIILEDNLNSFNKVPSLKEVIELAKKNKASQMSVAKVCGVHKSTVFRNWDKKNERATCNSKKKAS